MKSISLIFMLLALSTFVYSQAPNKMSFQTVVRNSQGKLIPSKSIGIRLSILKTSSTGTAVYVENHTKTSNVNGLVTLEVGMGTVTTGTFATIDWSQGPYFLKTEMDVNGGSNYTISGLTEFVSVPYSIQSKNALYSDTASNVKTVVKGTNVGDMNYWNGVAWVPIVKGSQGQTLTYCEDKPTWTEGGLCPGKINTLECNSVSHSGVIYSGRSTNVSSIIPYVGGNGGVLKSMTFSSEGVLGLVATIYTTTLENGNGSLNLSISGIAQSEGEAIFNINVLGGNCILKRQVINYPASVTSLNCSTPYVVGQLIEGESATNITGKISYYYGNGGSFSTLNVNSAGVSGLTAVFQGTTLLSDTSTRFINYSITGTPTSNGTASFTVTIGGKTCTLNRTVSGKIILVSLDGNSGVVNPTSLSLTTGASYGTLPVPTRTGYSFTGWELNGVVVTSQTKVLNSSNHTLIAKWVGNTYLITFDANGGSVNPTSQNVVFGTTYGTLPVPTRTGYTFTGWDLNGSLITLQSKVSNSSNHTLIAKWVPNNYQVIFNPFGGTVDTIKKNVVFESVYGILPKPLRIGYTFLGWYLNNSLITSQSIVTNSADHTLTAKWDGNSYLVTFDSNSGTVSPISKNVIFGKAYGGLPTPLKIGYTFLSWDLNGSDITDTSVVKEASNHALIAKWIQNPTSGYGFNITDIDGNSYKTVYIGTQQWMAENLKVSKYNNGDVIPNSANTSIGAWVYYNNDETNNIKHGKLYNWYAVNTGKLCPIGWHVPTDGEWTILTDYLGGANIAGGKMKEVGSTNWSSPNIDASNTSLFSALPSGLISATGVFRFIGTETGWWSSSMAPSPSSLAIRLHLNTNDGVANKFGTVKNCGFSIRCLKD